MQVVLITGGSSGIGKATGELLQSNGYAVIGTSRSPDHYTDHPFPLIQMDLRDAISIQKAVESVVSQYGAIHVLVNNAGKGIAGPIEETPLDEIRSVFETNLVGATAVIQFVIPVTIQPIVSENAQRQPSMSSFRLICCANSLRSGVFD